jgi:2-polyprenyl-3-methyl-5-hydroxy-6-metoxy-1,4-benzoquinol methylase
MKQWYETVFENYAETYDKECFTQGTVGEVDFIEKEINFDKTKTILDIGCGTGRHSIELAKRGYNVTGVDLSNDQLSRAIKKAEKENVKVDFSIADARNLPFENRFDLVIMMCEGAFPLMETDEMNFEILKNAHKALKPNGKFIFTTLNGLFPVFHSTEKFVTDHGLKSEGHRFDWMTLREASIVEINDDSGNARTIECVDRYYMPSEISWLLHSLNFKNIDILGCETGAINRELQLKPEHFEMLVIAEKS